MTYYKSPNNTLHYLDDDNFAYLLPAGCVQITDEEAQAIRNEQNRLTTDQAKAVMWQKIKAERDHRTESGGYKVNDKWFHSDQVSRTQQLGLVLMGNNFPENLQWKTMDGSFITMTSTLAQQILAAAAISDQTIFANAEIHRAAMEISDNPMEYDYSAGWPTMYSDK